MTVDPAQTEPANRAAHRLQLSRDTSPLDLLAMVRNVRPDAAFVDPGDGTRLPDDEADGSLHPIDLGDGTRLVPDEGPRGAGRWTLDVPRERETDAPDVPGGSDPRGYARAFPDGLPFGVERGALDLVWSLGRRLYGAIVTDAGVRIEPHPFQVRDLTVVSPHALAPESLAELIAGLEPEAELDQVPEDAPRTGYSATIPLEDGEEISLRVGKSGRPPALAALDWLDGAVDYELVHVPADGQEGDVESPDLETTERWVAAYRRIGLLAGMLVETVGGYIVDRDGFLVSPDDLG